jgi:hypothetical protein
MPLTADEKIPIPSDWVVTMVNPTAKLKEMYIEDIVNYGKADKGASFDKSADTNLTD